MRLTSPRLLLAGALCLAIAGRALSQGEATAAPPASSSSIDDLFANSQGDTEATTSDAKQLLAPFHAQPLIVSGSLSTMAGGVIGLKDRDDATSSNGPYTWKVTPGMSFVPIMTFSARPDETVRFQGTMSFPFQSDNQFSPVVNEMFIDYTLQDEIYIRIGKHLVSWGVTRIFDAGGDLMSSSSSDLNIKMTVPIGTGGVTGVLLAPQTVFTPPVSWKEFKYGLQTDVPIFEKSEMILSGTCYGDDDNNRQLHATAILKTSILGFDLFTESISDARLDTDSVSGSGAKVKMHAPNLNGIVSGFYGDWLDHKYTVYGEYYIDATDRTWKSQFTSVVMKADRAFGSPLDLALQWTHAYLDGSGIITPGFSTGLLPHIKMQLGFPCRYGKPDSYYLVNESPSVQTAVVPTTQLKWYQRYGVLLRLTMDMSF